MSIFYAGFCYVIPKTYTDVQLDAIMAKFQLWYDLQAAFLKDPNAYDADEVWNLIGANGFEQHDRIVDIIMDSPEDLPLPEKEDLREFFAKRKWEEGHTLTVPYPADPKNYVIVSAGTMIHSDYPEDDAWELFQLVSGFHLEEAMGMLDCAEDEATNQ